jgi:hypothetical protein
VLVISALHYLASTHTILVHEILRRLYYVPIVIAATRFGIQGGLATSLLASALYLPHIVLAWSGWPVFEVGHVARGLTLPLVRRLIENQGGNVKATPHDHRLEFVIDLPTSNTAVEAAALPLEAAGSWPKRWQPRR